MDFDTLLDQITVRVAEKIAEIESEEWAESAKRSESAEGAKSTASAGSTGLPAAAVEKEAAKKETVKKKEWEITKRVVTEKDVKEACRLGADCLLLGPKTIMTDLAKDRAETAGLSIIKK